LTREPIQKINSVLRAYSVFFFLTLVSCLFTIIHNKRLSSDAPAVLWEQMDFIRTHPYLIANLPVLFLILVAAWIIRPRNHGRISILSGLTCLPCAVLALLHNDRYWKPIRLGNGPIGIEDFIFTFVSGTMIWLLAVWPFRHHHSITIHLSTWVKRSIITSVFGGGLSTLLWFFGIKGLENTLIAGILILLVFLFLRLELWPLSVMGVVFFVPIYFFIVKAQFSLWPGYPMYWNLTSFLGLTLMGIPAGELAYAFVFAAFWPIYMAYLFDIRLKNS
jgi:hypothetical protein